MNPKQKITPFLWFDNNAEEAINYYVSIFNNARIVHLQRNGPRGPGPEVDELWDKLGAGGAPGQCGWLKDKFGLSWQIVPGEFLQMIQDPDPAKSGRVMAAMMQMTKFDIGKLRQAYLAP